MSDIDLVLSRSVFNEIILKEAILDQAVASGGIKVSGSLELLDKFFSYFDEFEFWFNLVTPQPPCAQRVPAAQGHLLRWRSSTMSRIDCVARMRLEELHRLSICPCGAGTRPIVLLPRAVNPDYS